MYESKVKEGPNRRYTTNQKIVKLRTLMIVLINYIFIWPTINKFFKKTLNNVESKRV